MFLVSVISAKKSSAMQVISLLFLLLIERPLRTASRRRVLGEIEYLESDGVASAPSSSSSSQLFFNDNTAAFAEGNEFERKRSRISEGVRGHKNGRRRAQDANEGGDESSSSPSPPPYSDFEVTSLRGLEDGAFLTKHYAGHISIHPGDFSKDSHDQLFSWLFHPADEEGKPLADENSGGSSKRLLIWLNGGPACSSMDGLWLENGPFRLSGAAGKEKISVSPHSWHRSGAHVVYVDQPAGTGLSFSKDKNWAQNDQQINERFHGWLLNFLKIHDYLLLSENESVDVFFSGESHAGHYIPSMVNYIRSKNSQASIKINVKGAAIGNGWMDPYRQYAVTDFALAAGYIGMPEKRYFDEREAMCRQMIDSEKYKSSTCWRLESAVIKATTNNDGKKISSYDSRIWVVNTSDYPPGNKGVERYLGDSNSARRKALLKQIHASKNEDWGQVYRECNDPAYNALSHQDGLGVVPDVVDSLNDGVRFLFFNGMNDIICNHFGNEKFLDEMIWNGADGWKEAKRYIWNTRAKKATETGSPSGWLKSHRNLEFLKVPDSGHMVPMDQPAISLEMITDFLNGGILQKNSNGGGVTYQALHTSDYNAECPMAEDEQQQQQQQQIPAGGDKGNVVDDHDDSTTLSLDLKPYHLILFVFLLLGAFVILMKCCMRRPYRAATQDDIESLELIESAKMDVR